MVGAALFAYPRSQTMNYLLLLIMLIGCGLVYVRFEQPKVWNDCLADLKAPEDKSAVAAGASSTDDDAQTNAPPPPPKTTPTIISPDSTNYINPDHVHAVDQPGAVPTNAPATNSPATNAAGAASNASP